MWLHAAVFIASLVVLIRCADYLVEYSARIARRFHDSDLIVGLIITSVGTSLPELASALSAALAGSSGLVIGNVVGSNIANTGLVLGVAAVVRPFATVPQMHDRDGYILLASTLIFFVLALDNVISRFDAALLLLVYISYVFFAARSDRAGSAHQFRDFLKFFLEFEYVTPAIRRFAGHKPPKLEVQTPTREKLQLRILLIELGIVAVQLAALIISARYLVAEAVWLAQLLNLPESLVGLSLIAIGTSLPELMVSISAARKGKAELIVGNIMGSNIANILLVVGVGATVHRVDVTELSVVYTIPIILFFSLALLHVVRTNWRIGRAEGAFAIAA